MTSDVTLQCAICEETADDPRLLSQCMPCGRTFHLNPFNTEEHKDCGDAVIGPSQGVEFWCLVCLEEMNTEVAAHPPDPRAQLEELSAPGGLFPIPAPTQTSAPTPAASPAPTRDAPRRRNRPAARRRYRKLNR
jgi:hypothetical protein